METLKQLFANMIVFVYHCFDRIVINGYLSTLAREENVVYFFRNVLGEACLTKEVLGARTKDYQAWVEAYARKNRIPCEWAQAGVRKEDYVRPAQEKFARAGKFGVYFILKSMEQGNSFAVFNPKFPTADPNWRILKKQRKRFTHYYFYLRDEQLGALCIRVGSFLPFQTTCYLNGHNFIERQLCEAQVGFRKSDNAFLAVDEPAALQRAADALTPELIRRRLDYWTFVVGPKFSRRERTALDLDRYYAVRQVEYCVNFIFRRHFPIQRLFERACELGLWRLTVDKISQVFGVRLTRRHQGKLQTMLDKLEQGHHTLRVYYKHSFAKMYEKFRTFLRLEAVSNDLTDLRLKKGLDNLPLLRESLLGVVNRFAGAQAQQFNAQFDFPLLQRLAQPVVCGKSRVSGLRIDDRRVIRLLEVLLHQGNQLGGRTMAEIHRALLTAFELSASAYTLNQLRYDMRKLKAHGLVERPGNRYTYCLTEKGRKVALLFVLFHQRLCGPLANSLFHHRTSAALPPSGKLEAAYRKADAALQEILAQLEAA